MKIRELHLRNIASIGKADIDFENDLKDNVTGNDASIFLISGDTGAGKSVILDGISMALYKTTPRIAGVANTNRNEFKDKEDESIRVGSIEQYTRLGISDKDECYSEVAFTGNDGIDYRVKLTLGMSMGNTDKKTGRRPIRHRNPTWEMKIGSGGWTKVEESVILDAVGLTFQQFGRMAMLAQGQFASFLTGDKKEREAILEQLTNTEHFTAYGKAITNIYGRAKEEKGKIETEYKTESAHILPQEKVDELTSAKAELDKKKIETDRKVAVNDAALARVTIIETNRAAINQEKEQMAKLEEIVKGEDYKSGKTLVNDWNATSTERQRLSDLKDAKSRLKAAKEEEMKQKETFAVLASDLQARREALTAMGNPRKVVDAKQEEIDKLNEQRKALEPAKTNEELSILSSRKAELSGISTRAEKIKDDEAAAKTLGEEIALAENVVKANAETCTKAKKAYDAASAKKEEASRRLVTMHSGIDDTMKALRKRLVDEHAEVCPLCGQKIYEIQLDDEFRKMVTPFEAEENKAIEELAVAEMRLTEARTTLDTLSGGLRSKREELERKNQFIAADKRKLGDDAAKFGIDITKAIQGQIIEARDALARYEDILKAAQKQAEDLQVQITKAQTEKKPLDEVLRKFTDDSRILKSIEVTAASITAFYPDWETDVRPEAHPCGDITVEWNGLFTRVSATSASITTLESTIKQCTGILDLYYAESGKSETYLEAVEARRNELAGAEKFVKDVDEQFRSCSDAIAKAEGAIAAALKELNIVEEKDVPASQELIEQKESLKEENDRIVGEINVIATRLSENDKNLKNLAAIEAKRKNALERFGKWDILNSHFGGTRFRTLVQTYILRPLLNNANIYLEKITDRYLLTCNQENEQLAILVCDRYNKDQIRSVTVLSGGERFMISLALSLALSSLNRPDMNVNILFIDEGFGTLDEKSLDSVMVTLEKLQDIAGQSERRVGIISHREELDERIPVQIQVKKKGEGRSFVEIKNALSFGDLKNCVNFVAS